jgi:hypothetical protein
MCSKQFNEILKKIFLCFFIISIINILSNLTNDIRINQSIESSNVAGELQHLKNLDNDMFTECAILYMSMNRNETLKDIFGSWLHLPEGSHPCDEVRILLKNKKLRSYAEIEQDPVVVKYHYGSRYIFTLMASIFDLGTIRDIYSVMCIIIPLMLGISITKGSGINTIKILYPIPALFYLCFSLNNLGSNVAHAPGFILPSLFLIFLSWNSHKYIYFYSRIKIYVFIAAASTYFDILTGPLPFFLGITIVINYFLFKGNDWKRELCNITLIFVFTFIALESLRLFVGSLIFGINEFQIFRLEIIQRLSNSVGSKQITYFEILTKIWDNKKIYFFNSNISAVLLISASAISWVIVLMKIPSLKKEEKKGIFVLLLGSIIIMFWFGIFQNHTYVHYGFMGRLFLLPIAAGFSAYILALTSEKNAYLMPLIVILITGILELSNNNLNKIEITNIKKYYDKYIDVASCSNEIYIKKDGLKDVVFEIVLTNNSLINFNIINNVTISRQNPPGAYKTIPNSFPVVVLNYDGKILSNNNRSVNLKIENSQPILLAFCADGLENKQTTYKLYFETFSGYMFESQKFSFN